MYIWNELFIWLERIYGVRFRLSWFELLFGIDNENNDKLIDVYNYCILLLKDYIYNCKVNNVTMLFSDFKDKLILRLEVEKYLACSQNKLKEFTDKWKNILEWC